VSHALAVARKQEQRHRSENHDELRFRGQWPLSDDQLGCHHQRHGLRFIAYVIAKVAALAIVLAV